MILNILFFAIIGFVIFCFIMAFLSLPNERCVDAIDDNKQLENFKKHMNDPRVIEFIKNLDCDEYQG